MTPKQQPEQELTDSLIKIRLFHSRNEAYFTVKDTLLFTFKAGIRLVSKELNELLSKGIITDLLNIENTRSCGVLIQKGPPESLYTNASSHHGNYILYTLSYFNAEIPLGNKIMENFWLKGRTLADHKKGYIYLCSLNRA